MIIVHEINASHSRGERRLANSDLIDDGTVTLIESVVAQLGLKQSRRNTVGSFTFQAAASGAVT
jgi:hypothetical protein